MQRLSMQQNIEIIEGQPRDDRMHVEDHDYYGYENGENLSFFSSKDDEVSDSDKLFDGQPEELKDTKDTEYHIRKDVVIKNIFRALRRFYAVQFRPFYDFTKNKVSKFSPSEHQIMQAVRKYVSKAFGIPDNATCVALMVAILDPTGKYTKQKQVFEQMREHVSRLLFQFNKKNLFDMFQIPEFISVLLYFLRNADINCMIPRYRNDKKTYKIYSKQVDKIVEVSMDKRMYSSKYIYKFL